MGKASHFFGTSVGGGTRAKLVVNSLMGTMLAAFGEGLALAESVGITRQTVIALEKGKYYPSLELAFKIAATFGLPLEEVFQYDGKQ